jgi:hypothetical protein
MRTAWFMLSERDGAAIATRTEVQMFILAVPYPFQIFVVNSDEVGAEEQ